MIQHQQLGQWFFFLVFALALDGFFNLLASQLFATALYLNVAYIPQNFIREIGVW